jgi:hypothetical protein
MPFDVHCFERLANGLADLGRCVLVIVFGPFCMAHSLVMAGEICSVRQHGNQSERNLRRPCSCLTLHYSQRKIVPEKALTISGADRFTRRGGTCRLHAIFMNQLSVIWGYQEELSSTAACPRAEGIYSINDTGRMRGTAVFATFAI